MSLLFSPTTLGPLKLKNHLVMSPLTRNRATGNVPNDLMVEYYRQRAQSAGLIITEGTSTSPNGLGYPRIPGIFSAAQVAGWKKVTDAVHAAAPRSSSSSCTPAGLDIRTISLRAPPSSDRRLLRLPARLHRRGRAEAARDAKGHDGCGPQEHHR